MEKKIHTSIAVVAMIEVEKRKKAFLRLSFLCFIAFFTCLLMATYAWAEEIVPEPSPADASPLSKEAAAQLCADYFDMVVNPAVSNINSMSDLANIPEAARAFSRCKEYGIDPPLMARPNYGRSGRGARTTKASTIARRNCPPLQPCNYAARLASVHGSLNSPTDGEGYVIGSQPNSYSAPQFIGHLPPSMPDHLVGGGSTYFYGTLCANIPNTSLLYPDAGLNEYATGGVSCVTNGHIATPPAVQDRDPTAEEILSGPRLIPETDGMINFDDGGIMILPPNFPGGMIGGYRYEAGEIIVLNHSGDFYVPAGAILLPFPAGYLGTAGEHSPTQEAHPTLYPPQLTPSNAAVELATEGTPASAKWW